MNVTPNDFNSYIWDVAKRMQGKDIPEMQAIFRECLAQYIISSIEDVQLLAASRSRIQVAVNDLTRVCQSPRAYKKATKRREKIRQMSLHVESLYERKRAEMNHWELMCSKFEVELIDLEGLPIPVRSGMKLFELFPELSEEMPIYSEVSI